MKFQRIFGFFIIACAITAAITAAILGEVKTYVFYIWLAVVIISRLQILFDDAKK